MKIVWIVDKYLDTSIDRVTWIRTAQELKAIGNDVLLVAGFRKEKNRFGLNGSLRYIPSIPFRGIGYASFCVSLIAVLPGILFFRRPDVLICHPFGIYAMLPFVLLRKLRLIRTRLVCDVRTVPVETRGTMGRLNNVLFGTAMRLSKIGFDGWTMISPFMRKVLVLRYGLDENRVGIWSSGASPEVFDPALFRKNEIRDWKKQNGLDNRFVVMYHGVLTSNRGVLETVEAMRRISATHQDIALFLLGSGAAGSALKQEVAKYKLANQVVIQGPVSFEDVPKYIAMADVGILPFPALLWWRVSSPIKLMEYLSMEKPVIVTDIEAHRTVIVSEETGMFIPSNDPADIARGILQAYHEQGRLPKMGREGRKKIQDQFTWEKQAFQLNQYLRAVVHDERFPVMGG